MHIYFIYYCTNKHVWKMYTRYTYVNTHTYIYIHYIQYIDIYIDIDIDLHPVSNTLPGVCSQAEQGTHAEMWFAVR